jgi:drug/metabolite transporter (DMT)-like permease
VEIVLALISAALFALGSVLQQKAGTEGSSLQSSGSLLLRMARRPLWVFGIGIDGLGFVSQAVALGVGRLDVVQPLMVTSVVFALPFGAWLGGTRVCRREVVAATVVVAGLAAFVALADPAGGRDDAPFGAWALAGAGCAAVCVPLAVLAPRSPGARRAAYLGVATGILFALSAALTKAVVNDLSDTPWTVLADWQLYGLIAVGYISMTLNQLSLDAGALAATMATSTAFDPIASVVLGLTLFLETIHAGPVQATVIVLALAAALGAMIVLAREQSSSPPVATAAAPP